MLTHKQLALIHIAKNKLGIDDDLYRDILKAYFKVDTSKKLNQRQFDELLNIFNKSGFKSNKFGVREAQINSLKKCYFSSEGIKNKTEEGFSHFVFSVTKKISLNILEENDIRKLFSVIRRYERY